VSNIQAVLGFAMPAVVDDLGGPGVPVNNADVEIS
jgi:hypothetical protein